MRGYVTDSELALQTVARDLEGFIESIDKDGLPYARACIGALCNGRTSLPKKPKGMHPLIGQLIREAADEHFSTVRRLGSVS